MMERWDSSPAEAVEIAAMRRQLRLIRYALLLSLLAGGGFSLIAASGTTSFPRPTLEAQKFEIMGPDNRPKIVLEGRDQGGELTIYNNQGRDVVKITAIDDGGAWIYVRDQEGRSGFNLVAGGSSEVEFRGASFSVIRKLNDTGEGKRRK